MLIAICPKCGFPIWFGRLDNCADDARCLHCELVSSVPDATKVDHEEWRTLMAGEDVEHVKADEVTMARNTFHHNMCLVAEKMELPTYLAEWRVLVEDDIAEDGSKQVSLIIQEELKCLLDRILKRLNEKSANDSAS